MPLSETSKEVLDSMKDQYGEEKGEEVFYATANKKGGPAEEASTWEKNEDGDENGEEKESAWADGLLSKLAADSGSDVKTELEEVDKIKDSEEPASEDDGAENDPDKQVKESEELRGLLGLDKESGKKERGKRDGTGPYEGSYQAKTKKKGKRQEAGEECPAGSGNCPPEKKSSLLDEVLCPNFKQARLEEASSQPGLEKEAANFLTGLWRKLTRAAPGKLRKWGIPRRVGRRRIPDPAGPGKLVHPGTLADSPAMSKAREASLGLANVLESPVSKPIAGAAMAAPVVYFGGRELLDPGMSFEEAQAAQNAATRQYHAAQAASRRARRTGQAVQGMGRMGDVLKTALIYGGIPLGAYGIYSALSGDEEEEEERR